MSDRELTEPPYAADEATMLLAYLNDVRRVFRLKTQGLTREQLAERHPPSTLTLAGLVKHLAMVEESWFSVILFEEAHRPPFVDIDWDATPDWEFDTAVDDDPDELYARYEQSVAQSDARIAAALAENGVETVARRRPTPTRAGPTLRWILLHMIDEYARHNGHADLIRESIDGSVGD